MKGDRVLFHGEPGEIDFVADTLINDPAMDFFKNRVTSNEENRDTTLARKWGVNPGRSAPMRDAPSDLLTMPTRTPRRVGQLLRSARQSLRR
jgi:hypothetical protein